jgi:tetratricopeptide (TPR) repeat protein
MPTAGHPTKHVVAERRATRRRHVAALKSPHHRSAVPAVLSALVCLCSPAAFAQWSGSATASYGMGLGSIALSQSILSGTRRLGGNVNTKQPANHTFNGAQRMGSTGSPLAAGPGNAASPDRMTPAQIDAALGYTPDPQVSAQVRAQEIKLVTAQYPALRPVLEKAFATDAVLREFDAFVSAHGFSSHNVADTMAALLWSSWQIVNSVTLTEAQIRGVHQQVRAVFLGNPQMRAMTVAGRQMVSESIAYLVMVEAAAMRTSDPAGLAQARQNAAKNIKNLLGLDLSQLEMTADRGFKDKPANAPGTTFNAALQSSRQEITELTLLTECNDKNNKDYERRIDVCTRLIAASRGNKSVLLQAYLARAGLYGELKRFDRMIADYDEFQRTDPQNPTVSVIRVLRAAVLTQLHEYDRALTDLGQVIASQPNSVIAEAYAYRANVYLRMASYDRALADANQAISLKPGLDTAYAVRALYHLEKDDAASALADASEAVRLGSGDATNYVLRAEPYFRMGQLAEAQADADRALDLNPRAAGAHDIRGRIALAQDRIEAAVSELTQSVDLDDQQPDTTANRGVAYERSGKIDLAIADYRRALALIPSSRMDRDTQAMARQRLAALVPEAANSPADAAGPAMGAAPAATAPPGRRIALLIGMSAYANVAPLRNPASDARAVADALRRLGFTEVIEREDLPRAKMEQVLKEFGDKANGADWAIIYYAGHGVEMNGVNYLVPIDAKLARADHVEDETVSLTRVLSKTEPARKLRMVILDACRNNPFPMASAEGRPRAIGRGLSRIEPTGGVLVAYAARNGTIADDGTDGHSPFTQALLANLETPGLDIRILFSKVRDQVLQRTHNAQEPFTYGSLPGQEFYFKQAAR